MDFLGFGMTEEAIFIGMILVGIGVLGALYLVIRNAVAEGTRRGRTPDALADKESRSRE